MHLDLQRPWSIASVLAQSAEALGENGIENPRINAERLLGQALKSNRAALYMQPERPLTPKELACFRLFLRRRLQHEPLQYVLGQTEFMSLPFEIHSGVLIPRPETEVLVEKSLQCLNARRLPVSAGLALLEIGTGSGCIAVSLASYLAAARIVATDISALALLLAARNAKANQVLERISFVQADMLGTPCFQIHGKFDAIISNPPYVSHEDYLSLPAEVRDHEPQAALTDLLDGLTFYRRIGRLARTNVQQDGFVALEVGQGQAGAVAEIMQQNGFGTISTYRDLNGIERVVICQK